MKRSIIALLTLGVLTFVGSAFAAEPAKYHIGICTGSVGQAGDDLRGAQELIKRHGDVSKGGMIKHITHPDNFMTETEATISQIVALADDPRMKAIIVNQGIPGTKESFRRIRQKRPDILLFAGQTHEDPTVIEPVADLVVDVDNISRGYLIVAAAQKLGVTDFVHISFSRHMSYSLLSRRRNIMEATAKDLGIKFHDETLPDPLSESGIDSSRQRVMEMVPALIKKYGPNTAFFCTSDSQTELLLKRVLETKGFFIEASLPSPLMGFPAALGINLVDITSDFPAILKRVEEAVVKKGGAGRVGTWSYSFGFTNSVALGEYAKTMIESGVDAKTFRRKFKKDDLLHAYEAATPGSDWSGNVYRDVVTGTEKKTHMLVYQDTYILGKGYLDMTDVKVPEKYFSIK